VDIEQHTAKDENNSMCQGKMKYRYSLVSLFNSLDSCVTVGPQLPNGFAVAVVADPVIRSSLV
jgi:hypothetical protein